MGRKCAVGSGPDPLAWLVRIGADEQAAIIGAPDATSQSACGPDREADRSAPEQIPTTHTAAM